MKKIVFDGINQRFIWTEGNRSSCEVRYGISLLQPSMDLILQVWTLKHAEKELRASGSRSQKNYLKVLPLAAECVDKCYGGW